ncbi:TPA: chloride channel protein [Streptococcus suis]|nr:chloride channel protein [Streptococcus suis]
MIHEIFESPGAYWLRFSLALLLTSLVAGVGGILLHDLLELVEWMIFGNGKSTGEQPVTNLQFIIILLAGIISAFIWFILQDKNRQIISIKSQLKATDDSKRPILWIHLIHIFLQVASVGAGSPIGKEGAPRELGALGAGRIADRMTLTLKDRRLAIVCGASAGLAAVYQVPIASIFFAFETLGLGLSFLNLISVSGTAFLASLIAGMVIADTPLYHSEQVMLDAKTCGFAIVLAILITPLAQLFRHLTQKVQASKLTTKSMLWKLPLTFFLLASFSLYFPEILGNGGALAQAAFDGMSIWYALACVVIKVLLVLLTLKNGAYGGTLTPSFSIGTILGFLVAVLCQMVVPELSLTSAMLIGSSIFLAITMNAPLTAVGLVMSFTGQSFAALPILLLAVIVAFAAKTIIEYIERNDYVYSYFCKT